MNFYFTFNNQSSSKEAYEFPDSSTGVQNKYNMIIEINDKNGEGKKNIHAKTPLNLILA
jgi:hypothetical protein